MSTFPIFRLTPAVLAVAAVFFLTGSGLGVSGAFAAKTSEAATQYYDHAVELIAKGDLRGAVIELKNALQRDPKDLASRVLLGRTFIDLEDGPAAEHELLRARKEGARDSFVLAPLGRAYVLQGRYKKALEVLSTAGQDQATAAEMSIIRGDAYIALLNFQSAEESFLKASKLQPRNAEALVGIARVKIATDDLVGARQYVKWAIEANPDSAEAWYTQGEIRRLQRKFDEALKSYDRAVELTPHFIRALLARASIKIDHGNYEAAEPDIQTVRQLRPHNPKAAYLQSLILARRGDLKVARDALVQAENILKTYPPEYIEADPETQLLAGVVSYFRKHYAAAYDYLSAYLKRLPNHLGARKLLASLALRRGETKYAIHLLKKVAAALPTDIEVMTMLGDALMRDGRYREANRILEKAAAVAKPGSSALSKLVMIQLLAGRDADAIRNLKQQMKRDPDAIRAALMLTATLLRQRKFEAALDTINGVIERQPKNAVARNLAAGAQVGLKDFEGAIANLRAAIDFAPNYREAIFNLAKLETRLGKPGEAAKLYAAVLKQDAKNGEAMMALAGLDERRNNHEGAIRWLEKARTESRTPHVAALRLTNLYMALQRPDDALNVARSLHNEEPANLDYLMALGRARLASKRLQRAAQAFREMATRAAEKKSAAWLHRAAVWQLRARDNRGAEESLKQALKIDDKYIPAHVEYFKLEMAAGNLKAALERARKVAALDRHSSVGNVLKGDAYMRMRDFDAALLSYQIALKKDGTTSSASRVYHARRANGQNALAFAEKWARQRPDDAAAQRLLATAYGDAGRDDEAVAIYERLLERAPKDTALLNNVALLYQKKGDPKALDYARRAYVAAPTHPAVMDSYGWILVRNGQPDKGLSILRNAVLRAPSVPEIHYHMGVALNMLGQKEEARRELDAALQFGRPFDGIADAKSLLAQLSSRAR